MGEGLVMDLLHKKLQGNFNEDDAKRLLCALDYTPFAITQAAGFISQRTPHTTLSEGAVQLVAWHHLVLGLAKGFWHADYH